MASGNRKMLRIHHRMAMLCACLFGLNIAGCIVNPVPTPSAPTSATADNTDPGWHITQDSGSVMGKADASADMKAPPGAEDGYSSADSAAADAGAQWDDAVADLPDAQTPVDASGSVTQDTGDGLACDGGCG